MCVCGGVHRGIPSGYTVMDGKVLTHSFINILVATVQTKLHLLCSITSTKQFTSAEIPTGSSACQQPSFVRVRVFRRA